MTKKRLKKDETYEVGRDGTTGLFIPPEQAEGKAGAVVHRFKKQTGKRGAQPAEPSTETLTEQAPEPSIEPETGTEEKPE